MASNERILGGALSLGVTELLGGAGEAEAQAEATAAALIQQGMEASAARKFAREQGDLAAKLAAGQTGLGIEELRTGREGALAALLGGQTGAIGALGTGREQALGEIAGGFGQARADLGGLADLQRFGAGATTAIEAARPESELARVMAGDFERDPSFQFRREEGERAIERGAAARGGRLSGRTLREMGRFSSGLASQEFGAAAERAGALDALREAQAGRQDVAGLQAQRNQQALAQMGFGAQGTLAQMASQQGLVGADVQGQFGSQLSNLLAQGGTQQAQAIQGAGTNIAQLLANLGQTQAGAATGQIAPNTALAQSMIPQLQAIPGAAGGQAGARSQAAQTAATILAGLASSGAFSKAPAAAAV